MEQMEPEIKLRIKIETWVRVVNPSFMNIKPKDVNIVKPKEPIKKQYLKGYLPTYLLYREPLPEPINSNAVQRGPAQLLPFWCVNWLTMPKFVFAIPWYTRMTIETYRTLLKYFYIIILLISENCLQ